MRRLAPLLAAALVMLAGAEARAQVAPGVRAPTSVADGVDQAFGLACFLATAGRPFPGLNMGMELAGEGLRQPAPGDYPDDLRPVLDTLGGYDAVWLDAPGGKVWIFFDQRRKRCVIIPHPLDAPGIEEAAREAFAGLGKPLRNRAGVYEFKAAGAPRLWFWYQPAKGGLPQMVITEQK